MINIENSKFFDEFIATPTLIYPSQISHITNELFPPDFEEVPDPGMEV